MSQNLTISETGLRLIKAFEGYRPVDRELVTGQRIVGYGHRLYSEDAVMMNKIEAETALLADLEPFEDMINSEVHAPMSQSQFDALCSFAYNIGPKAFLKSDTLRALNNGRPLDAANGLDVWRKSEIAGKTYVVDALMRRRTAEKALFLLTDRDLPAGRADLPPIKDTTITGLSTEDALPVFTEADASGIVATAPYEAHISPKRRREDGPAGTLQLSELDILEASNAADVNGSIEDHPADDLNADLDIENSEENAAFEIVNPENEAVREDVEENSAEPGDVEDGLVDEKPGPSPIAAAATDIVARLDALIENADTDAQFENRDGEWPESLLSAEEFKDDNDASNRSSKPKSAETDLNPNTNVVNLNRSTAQSRAETLESSDGVEHVHPSDEEPVSSVPVKTEAVSNAAPKTVSQSKPDSASKYIEKYTPEIPVEAPKKSPGSGLWIPIVLGFLLLGPATAAMIRGSEELLGAWGPIIAFTGYAIGLSLIFVGIYAALRIKARS